jgi:hypothetical protein
VKVVGYQKQIIQSSCKTNDSRFREGDLMVLRRGNPRDPDALHCELEYDRETILVKSSDVDTLFENHNAQIIERGAAGIFSLAGADILHQAKVDQKFPELLLSKELQFCEDSIYLNCGANLIFVVQKCRLKVKVATKHKNRMQ